MIDRYETRKNFQNKTKMGQIQLFSWIFHANEQNKTVSLSSFKERRSKAKYRWLGLLRQKQTARISESRSQVNTTEPNCSLRLNFVSN